jgi:hypothetical protein
VSDKKDMVNHPPHYTQGGVECIEAIKAATAGLDGFEGYCTGNALKYLWRWKRKNGIEDLKKAVWYIDRLATEVISERSLEVIHANTELSGYKRARKR